MYKQLAVLFAIFFISSCGGHNDPTEDFMHGFKWHQSMYEIKKLELANLQCESAPEGWACSSRSSPTIQKDKYHYFFVVLKDKGLASLTILDIKQQFEKNILFNNYNQLSQRLTHKFGAPTYQTDDCLSDTHCGEIKSQYDYHNVIIRMNLMADGNNGILSLMMAIDNNQNRDLN
ncbi:hypothetical protein [Proteus myxofaciens]|uniref:Lipoprotein n=1 Tax=Proteus myxofaciens ATCC 19692 TaxID=1354337 RepID=A0A198FFY0_9GAMM|nr:hypothetical protein [Proteus myxofaciens]OAT23788.1 hypothetical protein M983_2712 [Proteus myxofaciens ATCC 19692]